MKFSNKNLSTLRSFVKVFNHFRLDIPRSYKYKTRALIGGGGGGGGEGVNIHIIVLCPTNFF